LQFQVVAEIMVTVPADTPEREVISEQAEGLWNHMLGREGNIRDATAVYAGWHGGAATLILA